MKGEAQANAMSVCVCATRQRRSHTGLLPCATCRVQCWRSPRGRARAAAELIAHCRSAPFLFFFTHRVSLHSTLGRSQGEGSQVWRIARGRSIAGHQGSSRDMKALALLCKPGHSAHKRRAVRNFLRRLVPERLFKTSLFMLFKEASSTSYMRICI